MLGLKPKLSGHAATALEPLVSRGAREDRKGQMGTCRYDRPMWTKLASLLLAVLALLTGCTKTENSSSQQPAEKTAGAAPSARTNHPEPQDAAEQCTLGIRHREGIGVPQDDIAAAKWFLKSAEQGNATAQFFLGVVLSDGCGVERDQAAAVRWYRAAADSGESRAQYNLALCFLTGAGVELDENAAAVWFRKAAEQGHARAQGNLGYLLSEGLGVAQDWIAAAKWFRSAAVAGEAQAAFNLGWCYRRGMGVERSDTEALSWFRIAALAGIPEAQAVLGAIFDGGFGVAVDEAEAAKWYRAAAEQGNMIAQFALGNFYLKGEGVARDDAKAAKWLRKAAEQGEPNAQYNLARCYKFGLGVPQDDAVAGLWYRRSAEQGSGQAQVALAIIHAEGSGVPQDSVEAYSWANLAAAAGVPKAKELRDFLSSNMTREELAEGQRIARAFRPRQSRAGGSDIQQPPVAAITSSGSGFFISEDGVFVTNHHVIAEARRILVRSNRGTFVAKVLRTDPANDVALLEVSGVAGVHAAIPICGSGSLRQSDRVSTIGFPNPQIQGWSAKYSSGEVAALSGPNDDPRFLQISTPLQPGNSGGPLFDSEGCVVGVVVSQLDKVTTYQRTGSLPENVNYAVKGTILIALIESVPGLAERVRQQPLKQHDAAKVAISVEAACGVVQVER